MPVERRILLVYPSSYMDRPGADFEIDTERGVPMGILCLAASLEASSYRVDVLDARLYSKAEVFARMVRSLVSGVAAVGFSVMTMQVAHALSLTRFVRRLYPGLPIIWGGIHPTLFPEQTASAEEVDYVIEGDGEYSLPSLLASLPAPSIGTLRSIPGLCCKHEAGLVRNARPQLIDQAQVALPAYHLLDIERYLDRTLLNGRKARGLDVLTSRGCPYRCAFCLNMSHLGRRWRPMPDDRVAPLVRELIDRYRLDSIWFMDDYFFGDIGRSRRIIENSFASASPVTWEANIRADNFRPELMDSQSLAFFRDRGCYALRMGAESGSDRVLRLILKDITVAQVEQAVAACQAAGIIPFLTFMMGIPGERMDEIQETVRFAVSLRDRYPLALPAGAPGIFRPYPGGELYAAAKLAGFHEPASLHEWAVSQHTAGYLTAADLPWLTNPRLIDDIFFSMTNYWLLGNPVVDQFVFPLWHTLVGWLAGHRARKKWWGFRIEARMRDVLKPVLGGRG